MGRALSNSIVSAAFLLPALLAGCALGRGNSDTSAMHRQFTRTMDIQTGVVLGDLDRAHGAAAWLADQEMVGRFPPRAQEHRAAMREQAALIAEDRDLASVATRSGRMAAACGSCHQLLDRGPRFAVGVGPGEGNSTARHMIRHLWAVDRMWEGLVGPSDEAWAAGGAALATGWDPTDEVVRGSGSPARAREFLAEMTRLGNEATGVRTQEARGILYGDVLRICAGCHGSAGPGGTP